MNKLHMYGSGVVVDSKFKLKLRNFLSLSDERLVEVCAFYFYVKPKNLYYFSASHAIHIIKKIFQIHLHEE